MKPADKDGPTSVVRLRIFVQGDNIRIERVDAGQVIIARLKENIVWSIDEKKGVYYEAALEEIATNWRNMRREKGIEEKEASAVSLKRGGERKSILWHDCDHYILDMDGKTLLEVWTDKDFDFPEKETIYEFRARMGELSPGVFQEIRKVQGFPLRMNGFTYVGTESMVSLREVKSIQRQDIDAEKFKLPDGLRKTTVGE
ncbi:MAG: DUF4412 domain-containing protein [Planctomycetota bacterium]